MQHDSDNRIHLGADEARGGEIILRSSTSRAVFLGGLISAIIVGAVTSLALVL